MIIYKFLSIILSPLIDLYLIFRRLKKKEDPKRFFERLGYTKVARPQGFLIWIHCASVGESKSALTLVKKLLKTDSKINILITSGTITSAKDIAKNLPERVIHQFVPIDKFFAVQRFMKYWRPDLAILVESEFWPNLIDQTKCPLILVNGRISDQSFKRWQFLQKLGFNLLQKFTICFAQSKADGQKFVDLKMSAVHFLGNLKSAANPLEIDEKNLKKLKQEIGSRKFWIASSTHFGEEEIIIKTHQKLKKHFPDLLTIIAPRHPNRLKDIAKLIPENLEIAIRSQNQSIANCEIYLADTLGELGTFYSLSPISFIGGSLFKGIGGHNPYEALQLGSVVLSGSFVANFQEVYQDLQDCGSVLMVENQENLLFYLLKLMQDEKYYSSILQKTKKFQNNDKILQDMLLLIQNKGLL